MLDSIAPLRAALEGRYEIEREIGRGGFATVYLARDVRHDRPVAIKVLKADATSENAELRFLREIKLLARLQHPNILPLIDSGKAETLLYYVMPYVSGESLRQRLQREGPLPVESAMTIAREASEALAFAHEQGIIHRDIKPENILLSAGHSVVADFGVARAIDLAGVQQLTRTGVGSPGTPAYMSPEQLLNEREVDSRSDIYSLGCVLFEMLTGAPPFVGEAGFVRRFTETPPVPSSIRKELPVDLDGIVAKALARDPDHRYVTGAELAQALSRVGRSTGYASLASTGRGRSKILAAAGAGAMIAILGFAWKWTAKAGSESQEGPRVLVLPLENRSGDASLAPVGEMAADWISRGLREIPTIQLVSLPPSSETNSSRLRELGEISGANAVVTGQFFLAGDSLQLDARAVDPSTGRVISSFEPVKAPAADPRPAIEKLRQRVMGAFAVSTMGSGLDPDARALPSYDAYREFIEGERLYDANKYAEALAHYQKAYTLDTLFPSALVRGAYAGYYGKGCEATDSLGGLAKASRGPLSGYEQQMLERALAWCRGDWTTAYAAAKRMIELQPLDETARYMAGRSALYLQMPRAALQYFREVDAEHGIHRGQTQVYRDIGVAYHMLNDYTKELETLRQGRARWPEDPQFDYWIMRPLAALGRVTEIDSVLQIIRPSHAPRAFYTAIGELASHGQPGEALRLAKKFNAFAQARPPDTLAVAAGRAVHPDAMLAAGDYRGARGIYDSLAAHFPSNWRYLAGAGIAAARTGDRATAEFFSSRLAKLAVRYQRGSNTYGRAQIAVALGERDEAVRLLRQAMEEGVPYYFTPGTPQPSPSISHTDPFIAPLSGYRPYEVLLKPKG